MINQINNEAVILLGSNSGDRLKMLSDALSCLKESNIILINQSHIYETAPWGNTDQPAFLNLVVCIETGLSARELLNDLLETENKMGRVRHKKWEQRCIDLDILFYNDKIINEDGLKIPHPHLHERRFTLAPLNEIMPDFIHPVFNKPIWQLLAACKDDKEVSLIT